MGAFSTRLYNFFCAQFDNVLGHFCGKCIHIHTNVELSLHDTHSVKLSLHYMYNNLYLTTILRGKPNYYPHFKDEESKVWVS